MYKRQNLPYHGTNVNSFFDFFQLSLLAKVNSTPSYKLEFTFSINLSKNIENYLLFSYNTIDIQNSMLKAAPMKGGTGVGWRFHNQHSPKPLTQEQADALLDRIMTELELDGTSLPSPSKRKYYRIVKRRRLIKRIAAAACLFIVLACMAPGTVIPVSISELQTAPASDSSSVQVTFQLNSVIPVREVTAQVNNRPLSVDRHGYQQYTVTVEENGYLLLDVCSITGMHSTCLLYTSRCV